MLSSVKNVGVVNAKFVPPAAYNCPRCKEDTFKPVYYRNCCLDETSVGLCMPCVNGFQGQRDQPPMNGVTSYIKQRWDSESIMSCVYCAGMCGYISKPFYEATGFPRASEEFLEACGQDFCKLFGVTLYWISTRQQEGPACGHCASNRSERARGLLKTCKEELKNTKSGMTSLLKDWHDVYEQLEEERMEHNLLKSRCVTDLRESEAMMCQKIDIWKISLGEEKKTVLASLEAKKVELSVCVEKSRKRKHRIHALEKAVLESSRRINEVVAYAYQPVRAAVESEVNEMWCMRLEETRQQQVALASKVLNHTIETYDQRLHWSRLERDSLVMSHATETRLREREVSCCLSAVKEKLSVAEHELLSKETLIRDLQQELLKSKQMLLLSLKVDNSVDAFKNLVQSLSE